ncbi:MAG: hypothetical protein ACLT49_07240 [Sutterella wadsworthensis]
MSSPALTRRSCASRSTAKAELLQVPASTSIPMQTLLASYYVNDYNERQQLRSHRAG